MRREPDPTRILEAIENARARLVALARCTTPIMQAGAALQELGKIVEAKNAYDAERAVLMTAEQTDRVLEVIFGGKP